MRRRITQLAWRDSNPPRSLARIELPTEGSDGLLAPGAGPTWLRFERVAKVRRLVDQCDMTLAKKEAKQRIWPFDHISLASSFFALMVWNTLCFVGFTASQIGEWIKALM